MKESGALWLHGDWRNLYVFSNVENTFVFGAYWKCLLCNAKAYPSQPVTQVVSDHSKAFRELGDVKTTNIRFACLKVSSHVFI